MRVYVDFDDGSSNKEYYEDWYTDLETTKHNVEYLPYVVLDMYSMKAIPYICSRNPLFISDQGAKFELNPNSIVPRKPSLSILQYYKDQRIEYVDLKK